MIIPLIFCLIWFLIGAASIVHGIRNEEDFKATHLGIAAVGGIMGPLTAFLVLFIQNPVLLKKYDKKD
jgi:hypothetical protein